MSPISQPIISNGMFLLLSCVGFLVYVFLYLSCLGFLSGNGKDPHKRPQVKGFDSMRGGSSGIPSSGTSDLQNPETQEETEASASFFDPRATFSPKPQEPKETQPEGIPYPAATENEYVPEDSGEEEDETGDWPVPGEYSATGEISGTDRTVIGGLTCEELQLLSQVRASLQTDPEAYPYLDEEYWEIQERVSELMRQSGTGRQEVVTTHLTSREKVIYNAVSAGQPTVDGGRF